MSYSMESLTADCYPGTTCLVNKLDLRDEAALAEYEAIVTTAKAALLEQTASTHHFDFAYYKSIHKFLFEDVYDWAGQVRAVNISKKGTSFVKADDIPKIATAIFDRLAKKHYFIGLSSEEFVNEIVDLYCSLNLLHPFREGNGRTQRVFFSQLIRNAGYEIHFSEIDTDELMIATILAAEGVEDHLRTLFRDSIHIRASE